MTIKADEIQFYSVFADGEGGGNRAGVVVGRRPRSTRCAQELAREAAVPTTGFAVLDPLAADQIASVRFFTPSQEIDACGHVMVAVAAALVDAGAWLPESEASIVARGKAFRLHVHAGSSELEQRLALLASSPVPWEEIAEAIGATSQHPSLKPAIVGAGLRHLVVPLADVRALATLDLDEGAVTRLAVAAGVDTLCVCAPLEEPRRMRMRDLCARIGDLEEPASGTTSAALGLYLAQSQYLSPGDTLVVEQGVEMGAPSRIEVLIDAAETARVRGTASRLTAAEADLRSAS